MHLVGPQVETYVLSFVIGSFIGNPFIVAMAVLFLKQIQIVLVELKDVPPLVFQVHCNVAKENVLNLSPVWNQIVVVARIVQVFNHLRLVLSENVR